MQYLVLQAHAPICCVFLVDACRLCLSYVQPNLSNNTSTTITQAPQWQHRSQCSPCTSSLPTLHTLPSQRPHHQALSIHRSSSPHSKGSTTLLSHSLHLDIPLVHPQGTLPRCKDLPLSNNSTASIHAGQYVLASPWGTRIYMFAGLLPATEMLTNAVLSKHCIGSCSAVSQAAMCRLLAMPGRHSPCTPGSDHLCRCSVGTAVLC
jgi:hypothetical protein